MTSVAGAVAVGAGELDVLAVKSRLAVIGWSPITIRAPDLVAVAATAPWLLRVARPFAGTVVTADYPRLPPRTVSVLPARLTTKAWALTASLTTSMGCLPTAMVRSTRP